MKFWKMSGAGNDFIMTDNRDGCLTPALTGEYIASLCRRGLSVGADGLIEIREGGEYAFRMKYYNSDGARRTCAATEHGASAGSHWNWSC